MRELLSFGRIRWHSLLSRWHFCGFLQTVQGRTIKNILLNLKFLSGFFCFSTHGCFLLLAPSDKRWKIFSCTVYKIGFSLDAENDPSGVFVEAIILISIYTAVFHFQLFQNLLHSQRTNNISNWSVQWYWKKVSRFFLPIRHPFTKVKPACRQSIFMHVLTSVACIAFSLNIVRIK